eukprot:IDg11516t1
MEEGNIKRRIESGREESGAQIELRPQIEQWLVVCRSIVILLWSNSLARRVRTYGQRLRVLGLGAGSYGH